MDMTGEYTIPANREKVWDALNDPEILRQCIPGCQELDKVSDTEFTAKVTSKVGPVRATFSGKVTLSDIDPPNGYTISGEGQGGVAGFAKGGATVKLSGEGEQTTLNYDAKAEVGGKLASVGNRLVMGVAKKTADDFFSKFSEIVGTGAPAAAAPAKEEPAPAAAPDAQEARPEQVQSEQAAPAPAQPAAPAPAQEPAPQQPAAGAKGGMSPLFWGVAIVFVAAVLYFIFT